MNSSSQRNILHSKANPRWVALLGLFCYVLLLLHPVLGHSDLFAPHGHHPDTLSHGLALQASQADNGDDCPVCLQLGSFSQSGAQESPVTPAFVSIAYVVLEKPSPTASRELNLATTRGPPTLS